MNINATKILQKALGPLIILMLAGAIYVAQKKIGSTTENQTLPNGLGNQCEFVNLQCRFTIDDKTALAMFTEQPVTEESITVRLNLPADLVIQSVWIEGDNMYMGKIPVLPDQIEAGEWEGWFMLGSCNEPVMRWKMLVYIEGRTAPALLYFTTTS